MRMSELCGRRVVIARSAKRDAAIHKGRMTWREK
jgi:hypothetical protein